MLFFSLMLLQLKIQLLSIKPYIFGGGGIGRRLLAVLMLTLPIVRQKCLSSRGDLSGLTTSGGMVVWIGFAPSFFRGSGPFAACDLKILALHRYCPRVLNLRHPLSNVGSEGTIVFLILFLLFIILFAHSDSYEYSLIHSLLYYSYSYARTSQDSTNATDTKISATILGFERK